MKEFKNKKEYHDLLLEIKTLFPKLSKGHKRIAEYIINNYETAPNMTAAKVGEKVGVSEATVVRFAAFLGYDGYPKFRKVLSDDVKNKLTTVQRMDLKEEQNAPDHIFRGIMTADIKNIEDTLKEFDEEVFQDAVRAITSARKVVVIGFRSTMIIAEYLGYYFNLLLDNVKIINYTEADVFQNLIRMTEKDVAIAISFPRYSKKTLNTVKFLKDKGVRIVTITDSNLAPIEEFSDYPLYAKSTPISFIDSFVAPLSIINCLVLAVAKENPIETKDTFNKLEEIWKDHFIFAQEDSPTLEEVKDEE
jgi:DNA-binding MurR/RpiR family transcriptional regulator